MLAGIARALRPGGVYLCVDTSASSQLAENLDHPLGTFLYTVSCMHCMTVSLADGGMGLGTMWGEQTARQLLREAGFTSVEATRLDGDIVNTYIIASKDLTLAEADSPHRWIRPAWAAPARDFAPRSQPEPGARTSAIRS